MDQSIQEKIEQMKQELQVDFIAIALSMVHESTKTRMIRWGYATGNTNQNYKRIRLQIGKGIGGIVWRTGRGYQATNLQAKPEKLVELPITRMEKLETIIAQPVLDMGKVKGVLLIGFRTVTSISEEQIMEIKRKANELTTYL